ncbi:hypothetical protein MS3_00008298 [Schistosoma haematobium]|uniref:Uncharacterized protein n=1 Tax=Schistosoma haematobium TaxID=6185 RepID=A0A922LER2_SCHHA|nr:hypothetical protein MS3_00008298 [Schistosoma haematobium]KAH9581048.1 hypothetical protein MS3_00008298 [Schistosoma haematobium]
MMKLAFDSESNVTCQKNSTCIFLCYAEPVVLSGIILTFIGLLIGLAIILIKKLHSTSIMNSIFMVITFIILIIGVGLLNLHTKGYEIIISVTVDTALASLAILLGVKLRVRERKLELILFSVWCVFGGIGIIFMRALRNHYVLDTSWISWWCAILINNRPLTISCANYYYTTIISTKIPSDTNKFIIYVLIITGDCIHSILFV